MEIKSKLIPGKTNQTLSRTLGIHKTRNFILIVDSRRPILRTSTVVYGAERINQGKLDIIRIHQGVAKEELIILKSYKRHLKKLIKKQKQIKEA